MRRVWWIAVCATCLLMPASGLAFPLDLSVGVKGGASVAGAREVPEDVNYGPNGRFQADPQLFGVVGVGGGAGLSVDARVFNAVGLETGVQYTADRARGKNDITAPNGEFLAVWNQQQKTGAFHIPLLVKGSIPIDKIRPYMGVGVEFVVQNESSLTYSGEDVSQANQSIDTLNRHNNIETSTYTMFQGTLGMEIDVGPVRVIPFEFRVGYNLGWSKRFDERVRVENAGQDNERFIYNGEFLGHASLYAGAYYRWDFSI